MTVSDDGSVTRWLDRLRGGDLDAARPLWERYFGRLVGLARSRLTGALAGDAAEDEEDAALSAFDSFCVGAAEGRFDRLDGRDDLWRLLVVMTARKACDILERRGALKRGRGRTTGGVDLDGMVGDDPTPEFAAMVAEEFRRLLDSLPDDSLRRVALLRMEGFTDTEIAERLDCGLRTVARTLDLIRRTWSAAAER